MIFTQYYLECLSQASYVIGDEATGRAVVVDPRRDVDQYLEDTAAAGLRIELVIETHFHADFLSGHLEIAEATGAAIAYGEAAETEFAIRKLRDGERIGLGDVTLVVLATPGHTPESVSVVVYEHADDVVPYGVLTGDTMFIGDVGRPDLLSGAGVTAGDLAGRLYDSLHRKLLPLPDPTRVFPAHGAGSACGKNLSTETQSTMGVQRRTNYALAPMDRQAFVDLVTEGQSAAPAYFSYDAGLNRRAHPLLHEADSATALGLDAVLDLQRAGAAVLDTRDPAAFAAGHLRGSLEVGLEGRFAEYAGSVLDPVTAIVLVSERGTAHEAKVRLGRIGFDRVEGTLDRPRWAFLQRPEVVGQASRLTVDAFAAIRAEREVQVVDVRNPGELRDGNVSGAVHVPLAQLRERIGELDASAPTVVYCAGGYRSAIAASLLRANGFTDVSDLVGGFTAWTAGRVRVPSRPRGGRP